MKTPTVFFMMVVILTVTMSGVQAQKLNKDLLKYTQSVASELDQVSVEHKETLSKIVDFISAEMKEDTKADIMVICTHNSRRSHIAQLWLQTAAEYYKTK